MNWDVNAVMAQAPGFFITYGLKLVMAVVVYVVGKWLAEMIRNNFV